MDGPPESGTAALLGRIADRARALATVDDAAVTRFAPPEVWDVVHATDSAVAELEAASHTLGEGPPWDARHGRRPVLVTDLGTRHSRARWPVWAAQAEAAGYRSGAVFPVRLGTTVLGGLSLYRHAAGGLTDTEVERGAALADAVLVGLLDALAGVPVDGGPGTDGGLFGAKVHQATGMVMVQLGVDATEALVTLRARAFAEGRTLAEVAADVVARRSRFSVDGDPA